MTVFHIREPITDEEFFAVLESDEYRERFQGKEFPILKQNGGVSFHNPTVLNEMIKSSEEILNDRALTAKNRWIVENGIKRYRSWLKQVNWIYQQVYLNRIRER